MYLDGCDVWAGRAIVSTPGKLVRVARALGRELFAAPRRLVHPATPTVPDALLEFSADLAVI